MEIAVIILALAIAMGQLHLQHAEIRRNGQINTPVHMTCMLRDKIDYDERIIQNMKKTGPIGLITQIESRMSGGRYSRRSTQSSSIPLPRKRGWSPIPRLNGHCNLANNPLANRARLPKHPRSDVSSGCC